MVTRGKDGGRDSQGVWDGHGHTAVFNMEIQQEAGVQNRELCSVSCGSLDGRGVWGRRDTCMAESLHRPPETVTTPLISRTCVHTKSLQPCLTPCDPMDHSPTGSSVHGESPGKNTESVSCHAFLQGIFPTQRSNCVGGRFFTTIASREACSPAILQYKIKHSF